MPQQVTKVRRASREVTRDHLPLAQVNAIHAQPRATTLAQMNAPADVRLAKPSRTSPDSSPDMARAIFPALVTLLHARHAASVAPAMRTAVPCAAMGVAA